METKAIERNNKIRTFVRAVRSWSAEELKTLCQNRRKLLMVEPVIGWCPCRKHHKIRPQLQEEDFDDKGLLEFYETNRVMDIIGLRAERYDSPENEALLRYWREKHPDSGPTKVPRNQLNPNYTKMAKYLRRLRYHYATLEDEKLENTNLQVLVELRNFWRELEIASPAGSSSPPTVLHHWQLPTELTEDSGRYWWALLDVRWVRTAQDLMDYLYHRYVHRDYCMVG